MPVNTFSLPEVSPYRIAVQNVSGGSVPPYALMQVQGSRSDGEVVHTVGIPQGGSSTPCYLANFQEAIATGGFGVASNDWPARVLVSALPSLGGECGPVAGSWAASPNGKGFTYIGGYDSSSSTAMLHPRSGASANEDFPIVRFWNLTATALPYGAIVGYGDPLDPPPTYSGRLPVHLATVPTPKNALAVLLADCPIGGVADAAPCGVVNCKINYTNASHKYVDAVGGAFGSSLTMASGDEGYPIIWRANQSLSGSPSLGIQWARVLLDYVWKSSAVTDVRAMSTGVIPGATGHLNDDFVSPGLGYAIRFDMPSGPPGSNWTKGDQIRVENWMVGAIDAYKPLLLDFSRTYSGSGGPEDIYIIKSEGCKPRPSG